MDEIKFSLHEVNESIDAILALYEIESHMGGAETLDSTVKTERMRGIFSFAKRLKDKFEAIKKANEEDGGKSVSILPVSTAGGVVKVIRADESLKRLSEETALRILGVVNAVGWSGESGCFSLILKKPCDDYMIHVRVERHPVRQTCTKKGWECTDMGFVNKGQYYIIGFDSTEKKSGIKDESRE